MLLQLKFTNRSPITKIKKRYLKTQLAQMIINKLYTGCTVVKSDSYFVEVFLGNFRQTSNSSM